ncbi:RidA family protein [Pelagicoccus sp. SDUM812002]|uniref:RidA family protein n=1 Tax=Pelagicoccus sp. SDUM812002 TaxID=3041266 RepID=UPI00280F099A|nr:RidA family protein [Pelagicoccus sp. SDUM812002]MDQ8184752.1 RidA family protein [Pelagicoccus sp. SDUM812002]
MRKLLLLTLVFSLSVTLWAKEVFKITPLEGAAYSSAATVDPMASLVFTKSYSGSNEDVGEAASDAFADLKNDLELAGLSLKSVVNVRGYLLSQKGEDMGDAMGKWSGAFSKAFADNELAPTRTSIGVTHLPGDATVALDVILAAAPEVLDAMMPSWANDRIYASSETPLSLRATRPYSSLLITSGVLADSLPGEGSGFGSMEQQSESVLSKLDAVLRRWGLGRSDLVFVRAMLSPAANEDGELATDFAGFEVGWETFWETSSAGAPPVSVFSAPGFSSTGRIVEIEFYAVFPDAMGPFVPSEMGGETGLAGPAWREGSETSFLSSSVAVARDAKLTWFAGVIDRNATGIYGQAMQSLLTLESRMAEAGLDYPNVVQLRAYLNIQDSFPTEFGNWNKAYRRFFDHSKLNPDKPVRSAFPIEELPAGALIEVEALGVSY